MRLCEWCGYRHESSQLCSARPKWGRRGFLAAFGVGFASMLAWPGAVGVTGQAIALPSEAHISLYGFSPDGVPNYWTVLKEWSVRPRIGLHEYVVRTTGVAVPPVAGIEFSVHANGVIHRVRQGIENVADVSTHGVIKDTTLTLKWPVRLVE